MELEMTQKIHALESNRQRPYLTPGQAPGKTFMVDKVWQNKGNHFPIS